MAKGVTPDFLSGDENHTQVRLKNKELSLNPPVPENDDPWVLKKYPPLAKEPIPTLVEYNYCTRSIELGTKFIGAPFRSISNGVLQQQVDLADINGAVAEDIEKGLILTNGGGLLVSLLFHWYCVKYKIYQDPSRKSQNPLYRNFKTLASAGAAFGNAIAVILPLSDGGKKFWCSIVADVTCFVLGVIAIPYWYIRHKIL